MKDQPTQNPAHSATKRDVPSSGRANYHRIDPRPISYKISVRTK